MTIVVSAFAASKPVAELVRAIHERNDETGYPNRLSGSQIPLGARIISVCDAYDAMTSKRVYRDPLPPSEALRRLHAGAGSQFDPDVVTVVAGVIADLGVATEPLAELEVRGLPPRRAREAVLERQ